MLDHVPYHVLAGLAIGQSAGAHDAMKTGAIHAGLRVSGSLKQPDHIGVGQER